MDDMSKPEERAIIVEKNLFRTVFVPVFKLHLDT